MLAMMFLSTLLVMGRLRGAARASDLQTYVNTVQRNKIMHSDDGKYTGKGSHPQIKSDIHRSLDFESFKLHVDPTSSSKISRPTLIKLYPPTEKPLRLHANMPMRFGRDSKLSEERSPNSPPNMPQRFGRSWEMIRMCAEYPGEQDAPKPPQTGRSSLFWSLLRTLGKAQSLNTGLYWEEGLDFSAS